MPGLVALLMPKYDRTVAQNITEMAKSMYHEDFYKKDFFNDTAVPFVASRVHLNILNKETQPIYNEDKSVLIMMDGELHSRQGIREKIVSAGHELKTNDDAELLLHLYEEMGEDLANNLNGWFLVIVHDIPRRKTLIVNDCLGLCPAFYAQHNDVFIVGSEVKCLLEYKGLSYSVNKESMAEYFQYGGAMNEKTMFNEIHRLPPASLWTYRNGKVSKKQYFDISNIAKKDKINEQELLEEAGRIFTNILPRYFSGNNVGLSLTGGWDTRAIFATMGALNQKVPCYTWCGPYRDSIDVKLTRKLTKTWGQQLTVFYIGKDFFDNFADYAHKTIYVTDGSAGIFGSHEVYLNNLVRNLAPIRLTGKYGSEIVQQVFILLRRSIDLNILSDEFLALRSDTPSYGNLPSIIQGLRWLWPAGLSAAERSQLVVRTPYSDRDLVEFLIKVPPGVLAGQKLHKLLITKNEPTLASVLCDKGGYIKTDRIFLNAKLSLISSIYKILATLDRAYLHPDFPHKFTKIEPFLRCTSFERALLGHCNLTGYRLWIKNELRDFAEGVLLHESTLSRPYLNPNFIKQMVSDHFGNRANYTREIEKLISFEIWHRLFIDQKPNCHD